MADEALQVSDAIKPGERAKVIASLEIVLRIMRKSLECFPGDDLETILVFLTVAAASASSHLRDPDIMLLVRDNALPDHLHKPISGRAVAESSGLPRETVRRRLDSLVASGRLARDARGFRTLSGDLGRYQNLEFGRFLIQELDTAHRRLARHDPS